jgi:hypothetical protein
MPQALLSFPGLDLSNWSLYAMRGVLEDKVMAGATPANPAALVRTF